jgi:integrase
MAKVKFTAGRVDGFQCESGKSASFFWDSVAPGLGLRAASSGGKSYIFQAKLNGQVIRVTIGAPATWAIDAAQAEARRLKVIIDNGQDPRQVKADALAGEEAARDAKETAKAAAVAAAETEALRNAVTLGSVWAEYLAERKPHWSNHHYDDHVKVIQAGGEKRARSPKPTEPGPLASLAGVRLVDLDTLRIEAWAKIETANRPAYARLAWRMLKAFLNWCAAHPQYSVLVKTNAAISAKTRESLGKPCTKNDVLQREQLAAWFAAVRQLGNPVITAYLQGLLLTGARREELAGLKWDDVDFQWNSMTIRDKVEGLRVVPLTPYLSHLLAALPRRNEWVFSSPTAESGRLAEPRIAHIKALTAAGLPHVSLHGLRRSFASLCEWVEMPGGISAQIMGHAPQGVREQNYIRRPLDLLRMWHVKIEAWILEQAGIDFVPTQAGLRAVQ